jgi:aspartyl-tRNA(Asn)/glutamyl-tRNA(Gln) amidotransferase subunit A
LPPYFTITGLRALYERRDVSPREVIRALLERIDRTDRHIGAYVSVMADQAIAAAAEAEDRLMDGRGPHPPLLGVPIAAKDIFDTAGVETACGSKILRGRIPPEDSVAIARLRAAGAVIVGKTNTHEFAIGGTTENPHFGVTRNPWNTARNPSGSSGGSGAAVAADLAVGAIGSDTGGSVRGPASACGLVGVKPTYGRVPVTGMFPVSWTLDHAGTLTRTAEDASILLGVLAGRDVRDPSSLDAPADEIFPDRELSARDLRVGIVQRQANEEMDAEVLLNFDKACATLAELGARLAPVALPSFMAARQVSMTIILAEAGHLHRRWVAERPDDYGPDLLPKLQAGLKIGPEAYFEAMRERRALIVRYREILQEFDALLLPSLSSATPLIGAAEPPELHAARALRFAAFSLTGLPAASVPTGFDAGSMPTGMQIVADHRRERTILQLAAAYEAVARWDSIRPPLEVAA